MSDNAYVWLYNPETGVNKQAVKVGQVHRDGIEVLSGIKEGLNSYLPVALTR
ncbi:hypothetical protein ACOBV9_20860 (plasmid) [Pseudoalteromonas espejiana]